MLLGEEAWRIKAIRPRTGLFPARTPEQNYERNWPVKLPYSLDRTVETADRQKYQGDFLVLAAGAQANFFDTPGADKHAFRCIHFAMLSCSDRGY
jgi:hypothetical protein